MASNPQSTNGSESEFEFIETPKAPTPTFEKFEECGVKTTSVSARYTLRWMADACMYQIRVALRFQYEQRICHSVL